MSIFLWWYFGTTMALSPQEIAAIFNYEFWTKIRICNLCLDPSFANFNHRPDGHGKV